jgi:hypothetical protein
MFGDRIRELVAKEDADRRAQIALVKGRRLLELVEARGFTVTLTDETNTIQPEPPEDMVEKLKASKQALITALKAQEPRE